MNPPPVSRASDTVTGTLFVLLAVLAGLLGGVLSLVSQVPVLMQGAHQAAWRALAMQHVPLLVAFAGVPALLGGFGHLFVPAEIDAPHTAFPRLGALSLVLVAAGFAFCVGGLASGGGGAALLAALALTAAGLLACAANLIATLLNMRPVGSLLGAMSPFAWSQMIAACLAVAIVPLAAAALTVAGRAPGRIDPVLLEALGGAGFWIMILPGCGLACDSVAASCGRPPALRRTLVVAMAAGGGLGFLCWAWPLLHGGAHPGAGPVAALAVLVPAVALAASVAATIAATMRGGRVPARLAAAPGLYALGLVAVLLPGSLAAMAGLVPPHYVLALGTVLALFLGFHRWIGARRCSAVLARLQFLALVAGVTLMEVVPGGPLHALGAALTGLSLVLWLAVLAGVVRLDRPAQTGLAGAPR